MGARSGSITYQLYHIDGAAETERDALLGRIAEFAFQPLTADAEDDFHHGWIVFEELLSTAFTRENVFRGELVCLGMRIDQWRLSSWQLLKPRSSSLSPPSSSGERSFSRTE